VLKPQTLSEIGSQQTLKLITTGRLTGLPHIAELRYTCLDGSFFVMAGSGRSDWVLNALASGKARANIGEIVYHVTPNPETVVEKERVLESFRRKYGSGIVDQWYRSAQLCLRLDPLGPSSVRGAARGESHILNNFSQWRHKGTNYYQSVAEAFDSASEEYDYTISHNYINTWIRKRSLSELVKITRQSDVLLEIGCGTGTEAIQISKQVTGIVATDISEKMLHILKRKVLAKRLDRKILGVRVGASDISTVGGVLPQGKVRVAYSFNGALNCEPELNKFPEQLSMIMEERGYFVCSIRNTLCLPETLSHSFVFQFGKMATRKSQPMMVSVGGMDIPSYYYSPESFIRFFRPYFRVRKMIGLPAFLPPAYLNDYYLRTGKVRPFLEKLEFVFGERFPFNRFGDQTLVVFEKE
jgi:SAM-dependent methyltransferase